MYRFRIALLFSLAVICGARSAPAQAPTGHTGHRHPSGAKILIGGTLVEPVCQVARQLTGSALARCLEQRNGARSSLVLMSSDSALYLVEMHGMDDGAIAAARKLIGHQVRMNGTVFRAGNGYVVLLDSLWLER